MSDIPESPTKDMALDAKTVALGIMKGIERFFREHRITAKYDLREGHMLMLAEDWIQQAVDQAKAKANSERDAARVQVVALREALKDAGAFIQCVGTEDPDDIKAMASIEQLSGEITGVLARTAPPKADGGEP